MDMNSNTQSPKKPAGLPPLPPMSKSPNIFDDLERGTAPKRSERNDPTATAVVGRQHLKVALTAIVAESWLQARAPFRPDDDDDDRVLVQSLEQVGQQTPVILERMLDRQPPEYRILDGHRRIAGLRRLGKSHVEAVVVQEGTEDSDVVTLSSTVRKNLSPLEWLEVVTRLEKRGLTHDEIGQRAGMSRQVVDRIANLCRLTEPLRDQVQVGRLGCTAAVEWCAVPPEYHEALAQLCAGVEVTVSQARTIAGLLNGGGYTVADAAAAAGCAPAAGTAGENAAPAADQATPAKARKPKANRILGTEAAGDLLRGYFPDLESRTVRSLAETATRRRTSEIELKTAGCFAAAGMAPAEALDRARAVAGRPWVRKVVTVLDNVADLEALCTGDHCPPDAVQVFPVLARRVGAIKTLGRGTAGMARAPKAASLTKS